MDAAPLRDCTAISACVYDRKTATVIELFHKIWTPQGDGTVLDFDLTLLPIMQELRAKFSVTVWGYDPAHLYQFMNKWSKNPGVTCFPFSQAALMTKATQSFYDLLQFKKFETYKDPEAEKHIINTVVRSDGNGFRIVKGSRNVKSRKPIDYVVSAIIASHLAVESNLYSVETPLVITAPFADMSPTVAQGQKFGFPFEV